MLVQGPLDRVGALQQTGASSLWAVALGLGAPTCLWWPRRRAAQEECRCLDEKRAPRRLGGSALDGARALPRSPLPESAPRPARSCRRLQHKRTGVPPPDAASPAQTTGRRPVPGEEPRAARRWAPARSGTREHDAPGRRPAPPRRREPDTIAHPRRQAHAGGEAPERPGLARLRHRRRLKRPEPQTRPLPPAHAPVPGKVRRPAPAASPPPSSAVSSAPPPRNRQAPPSSPAPPSPAPPSPAATARPGRRNRFLTDLGVRNPFNAPGCARPIPPLRRQKCRPQVPTIQRQISPASPTGPMLQKSHSLHKLTLMGDWPCSSVCGRPGLRDSACRFPGRGKDVA